ncbi:hypothetical protein, partial [Mesorhizobium japonicum]|uniref:hypothetical protein n=1 Tax=Mesorhizobium japonicum TaxID=2066070 RepID=UPI003B5C205F
KPKNSRDEIINLKKEIQFLNEEILCYTIALETSMEQARSYAKKTNNLVIFQLCEKQQLEIYALLKYPRAIAND